MEGPLAVTFYTDRNLEDFLGQEIVAKFGLLPTTVPAFPTNTGFIVIQFLPNVLQEIIQDPPTIWTVHKVRVQLFAFSYYKDIALENTLKEKVAIAASLLNTLGIGAVNCRVFATGRISIPEENVFGLLKRILQSRGISLLFRRKLPYLHIKISPSKCQASLEIGRLFAPKRPYLVHHTPLSPAVAYALLHLAIGTQTDAEWRILDPFCGNGTLLYVAAAEAHFRSVGMKVLGIDRDRSAIDHARSNLEEYSSNIILMEGDINGLAKEQIPFTPNFILTHPPYGFAPIITPEELEDLYNALFILGSLFPGCIIGIVTPHENLLTKYAEEFHLQALAKRPFQQKTLPSFLWIGRVPPE